MYSALFSRNFPFSSQLELLKSHPPIWVNYQLFWFIIIFERWQSEIWNDILFWYFKLLFSPDSQKCFERRGYSVGVFHDSACRLTHHQYYITDINSDSRGSESNWWISEKQNAVTLGRAGYITDDELIVYNSMTVSQKVEPGRGQRTQFSSHWPHQYVWRENGLVKSP